MSTPSARELTRQVKAEALRLGFRRVGVTTPDPPPHLDVYRAWLAAGRHGSMGYLASEHAVARRADPRRILPGCRSVLVVAMAHDPPPAQPGPAGRVAAYARGDDYHDVLPQRLRELVRFLEALVGAPVPHRIYTDTGPLLERELAQRAGLGWIGKNTCLISPQDGSYLLLAEALLGLELVPDAPFTIDRCGSCTRCIEACPTTCIRPDRTLDATRCLSYLTIESRDPTPAALRPAAGEWLFGCDICQQVCPWNERFAPAQGDPVMRPRPGPQALALPELLGLDRQGYHEHTRRSPLRRARLTGWLRNAATVAGNRRDAAAVAPLARLLMGSDDPAVRAHAAWALGRIGGAPARQALAGAAAGEADAAVRADVEAALQASAVSD